MYEQKYLKYKKKYLELTKLKSGGFVPDEITSSDINDAEDVKVLEEIVEFENEEEIEEKILGTTKYVGDSNITTDANNKTVKLGNITGKIFDYELFSKEEFTHTLSENKILEINNKNLFDEFTNKYGIIKNKVLLINWQEVSKHFRGIIVEASIEDRAEYATYLENVIVSWVSNEYGYIDDVILFTKKEKYKYEKTILEPFKGHIVDYYAINEDMFVTINEEITHDKILVINSIKHFDQFTQKYGKNGKVIKWYNVWTDYIGIYIGDDIDMKKNRYEKCFFNEKLVTSWWSAGKLESELVYMFA
jgi:hypothetical protein